ncbi:pirin family protein [Legionella pneumophila serogroup 1]|uniref:Pirin-like protein n=1 Tax=Legionella pneumophila TaxID=446 RepID=A0A378K0P7_LEGPN|nr:pirin family protein [Legionella pneumophila]ABQ54014.1 pirin-like protein [Legionella pneumophila str. Corby]ADG23259.1 pirin-like protein [Legionella pneumophila 2300/99 Alcoy]MCK1870678.1 pirin family protein [Legionella pneumophila]MCO1453658.1 pirin family protein [Legionella pneumophila]MCW8400957.1 pirin family protein [Legionella pneumophila]
MKAIEVERLIQGTLIREGGGVKLRRYIGADKTNHFEPILLFDYFDSSDPLDYLAGFPPHPHRGFETITYLMEGSITHEDNKGNKGVINAGGVQWMTAGKGIIHSEMPSSSTGRLHGLQLWLNLPAAEKWREPRYQEKSSDQLPIEVMESGATIKVIAGRIDQGLSSPIVEIATRPLFLDINLPANATIQQTIPDDYQAVLFVIEGAVNTGGQQITAGTLASLTNGERIQIEGKDKENRNHCLLIAAAKLHEPIVRYGPFVMNTQEEITQAIHDFRTGHF